MRIALAGASGTGKTRLARLLAERYDLPLCPVGSRSVAASMGLASGYEATHAGRRVEFQERLLAEKREWEDKHDRFVTDRSHLDNLTYSVLDGARDIDEAFYQGCFDGVTRYAAIVHLPLHAFQNLGGDTSRVRNPVYHRLFERVLAGFLEECDAERYCNVHSIWARDEGRRQRQFFDAADRYFDILERRPAGFLTP